MGIIRKAADRGHVNFGWLDSRHSFSFGNYHDPRHMGFAALRVINDDRIAGGGGFPMHPHRDMEIITYVLQGALTHKDSLGTGSTIHPGDIQRMSAGSGIRHSEFNASPTEPLHFLQIWIMPDKAGGQPSYEQKKFDAASKNGVLRLVASKGGRDGSISINASADLYASLLNAGDVVSHAFASHRVCWIQVAAGSIEVDGQLLQEGDGFSSTSPTTLTIKGLTSKSEFLLFDLAA